MKILLIRFSSIGDIVLCSPVIRCLREQLGAEVHFLTKKNFAAILEANPHVQKVYSIEKRIGAVSDALRAERYDQVIDLHHNLRSLQVKWLLGKPSSSFDKLNYEKWLLVNFGIDRLPQKHIVDRYLETVRHLGVTNDGKGLDYFIPEGEIYPVSRLFEGQVKPFAVFVLGATHATKRLPAHKIEDLVARINGPVVLLGGKSEAETGTRIALLFPEKAVNCCGALTLNQSASVVQQASVVLSHDTGMMHIAAAFQKVIVSVWGNTVPAFGMYPYYPTGMQKNTSVEVSGLRCRPCSKIGHTNCPKKHFQCMEAQDTAHIAALVNRGLQIAANAIH